MHHSVARLVVVTLGLLVSACTLPAPNKLVNGRTAPALDPNVPGATGMTVVPGDNSTVAGDAAATYDQQKWPMVPSP